jgi:uncharacterized membrane protein
MAPEVAECSISAPPIDTMTLLLAGLVIFLGIHSVRIFADDWRTARIAAMGPLPWKALYSVISIIGFAMIVYGYGLARQAPVVLWSPPVWTKHVAALLTLPVFIFFAAAYVPGTRIKAAVKHPMVLGVKTWAIAHVIANGTVADTLLFNAFLLWGVLDYIAARTRDRKQSLTYPAQGIGRDIAVVVVGLVAWVVFAKYLHGPLIGVAPFG